MCQRPTFDRIDLANGGDPAGLAGALAAIPLVRNARGESLRPVRLGTEPRFVEFFPSRRFTASAEWAMTPGGETLSTPVIHPVDRSGRASGITLAGFFFYQ